jgi:hypothetical protein
VRETGEVLMLVGPLSGILAGSAGMRPWLKAIEPPTLRRPFRGMKVL